MQGDVTSLLRARNTLLWIVTTEEVRVERAIIEAAAAASYDVRIQDCWAGVTDAKGSSVSPGQEGRDPQEALRTMFASEERQVWIFRDLHKWLSDPVTLRAVRNCAKGLQSAPRNSARSMVVICPDSNVPPELAGHTVVLEWPRPDREEVGIILDDILKSLPEELRSKAAPNGTREAAIDAAVGLTAEEAASCYAKSLVQSKTIDPLVVAAEKKRVVGKLLEWHDPLPGGLDSVGGIEELKDWLKMMRSAYGPKARAKGINPPKGVLLVGIPGCGKSLTAKAVATAWGFPLLRFDVGATKSKYVGESERNFREALRIAETVAPCVLWLDEVEKMLAGASGPAGDGGVAADAMGTILSWMQDRAGAVFVIATANDIERLPPEFLRKGRFDEIFFVDLPNAVERRAIFEVTLKKEGVNVEVTDNLVSMTDGFSGAEIAALVPEAKLRAFAEDRDAGVEDIAKGIARTVPQSKLAAEKIQKLRTWASGRARMASKAESKVASSGRSLDF